MKTLQKLFKLLLTFIFSTTLFQCTKPETSSKDEIKILFLHHSTGRVIYKGASNTENSSKMDVSKWFDKYNSDNNVSYKISEQYFPKESPYGWNNYPYDYYNIWVKNGGSESYMEEPSLETLSNQYDVIIFKHCFPVSDILDDINNPDLNSDIKRIENYKLQYLALKEKLLQFPDTKFIVWTGAALLQAHTSEANATRARAFFEWVKNTWDTDNDNIYIWDFFELETEGGLYLKVTNAASSDDSHPGVNFASSVAPLFCNRIVDVIEYDGKKTTLTGNYK